MELNKQRPDYMRTITHCLIASVFALQAWVLTEIIQQKTELATIQQATADLEQKMAFIFQEIKTQPPPTYKPKPKP